MSVAMIVPTDKGTGTFTVTIGARQYAQLCWVAARTGIPASVYASRLLADVIKDDAEAHNEVG